MSLLVSSRGIRGQTLDLAPKTPKPSPVKEARFLWLGRGLRVHVAPRVQRLRL